MLCYCSSLHLLLQSQGPPSCCFSHGHTSAGGTTTCASSYSCCSSPSSSSLSPEKKKKKEEKEKEKGKLKLLRVCMAAALSSESAAAAPPLSSHPETFEGDEGDDAALVALLRAHDTDAAYRLFASKASILPSSPVSASRLLAQLCFRCTKSSSSSFSRAALVLQSLRERGALQLLDGNSLSLAAAAAARSGNARLAHSLILYMLRQGLLPDRRAYTAAVARVTPPAKAIRLFDAVLRHIRRAQAEALPSSSCLPDTAAFNAALSACADAGDCRAFRRLFDAMSSWGGGVQPDAVSYNVVIKMCARAGRGDLVARVLERILSAGIAPCATTFHSLVAALVGLGDVPAAERVVQAMREGRTDMCAMLRAPPAAAAADAADDEHHLLLDDIVAVRAEADPPLLLPSRPCPPNARVYTTLMKGYMSAGRVDDVVAVLRAMRREAETMPASRPDPVAYTTAISALAGAGDMGRARALLQEMAADGVPPSRVTYNVLLRGYCQQLRMGEARGTLQEMEEAMIRPDVVTYNTLMDGCVATDDCAGALALFQRMRSRGIAPSAATYTTLMKAFAASGQPRVAQRVFDEMERDPRVAPDRAAWNMLVEAYCRQGMLQAAKQAVERMKKARGASPDVATYGSLAKAIGIQGKPGEALLLWEEVKGQRQLLDAELLGALADVCVRAGFFSKALEMVAAMEAKGIAPDKTRYRKMYVDLHSRMFTSRHASQARQDRRRERKRAAEAFKFWLGLPNSYYATDWRLQDDDDDATE